MFIGAQKWTVSFRRCSNSGHEYFSAIRGDVQNRLPEIVEHELRRSGITIAVFVVKIEHHAGLRTGIARLYVPGFGAAGSTPGLADEREVVPAPGHAGITGFQPDQLGGLAGKGRLQQVGYIADGCFHAGITAVLRFYEEEGGGGVVPPGNAASTFKGGVRCDGDVVQQGLLGDYCDRIAAKIAYLGDAREPAAGYGVGVGSLQAGEQQVLAVRRENWSGCRWPRPRTTAFCRSGSHGSARW